MASRATAKTLFLIAISISSFGATICVGPSATGSGSGSNWSNQKAWTDTPVRGDTWYLRGGTGYANKVFNVANSGTTRITIKKATTSDHVTETGWISAYGTDQAVGGTISMNGGDYWTFDGQEGDLDTSVPYGLKFSTALTGGVEVFNFDNEGANSIVRYVEIAGPGGSTDFDYDNSTEVQGIASWGGEAEDTLIQYCYVHGCVTLATFAEPVTIEHSYFTDSRSQAGVDEPHSNVFYCGFGATGIVFRYNKCRNYNDEGFFITGFGGIPSNIKIYGNVFTSPNTTLPRAVELRQDYSYSDIFIYNNTMVDLTGGGGWTAGILDASDGCTGCQAYNNISVNAGNDLVNVTGSNNTDDSNEARFVNYAGGNFRLGSALAGTSLASEYNTDPDGETRGADGTWDRGAFEFDAGGGSSVVIGASLSSGASTSSGASIR